MSSLVRFKDLSSETGTTFCLLHFPLPADFIPSNAMMQMMKCKLRSSREQLTENTNEVKHLKINHTHTQKRIHEQKNIWKQCFWCRAQITLEAMVNNHRAETSQSKENACETCENCAPCGTGLLGYCLLRLEVRTVSPFQRLLHFRPNLRLTTSSYGIVGWPLHQNDIFCPERVENYGKPISTRTTLLDSAKLGHE